MPELPDVEMFKQYLDATALHQAIEEIEIHGSRVFGESDDEELRDGLTGHSFQASSRYGKYLFVALDSKFLVLHFGMTGSLHYYRVPERQPKHAKLIVGFADGYRLAYANPRRLGTVRLTDSVEQFIEEQKLGPDALKIGRFAFLTTLSGVRGMVKSALMNQKRIAGLGNIYSDEVLFQAQVHPRSRADRLSEAELAGLYEETRHVLHAAIDARAEISRLPESFIIPHREEDEPCPRCGTRIETVDVAGRTAYYCPACQPPLDS